jgi:hypothetical protein
VQVGSYACGCTAKYVGPRCETASASSSSSSDGTIPIAAGVAGGVGVLLLIIVILVVSRRSARQAEANKGAIVSFDEYEIDPNNLILHEIIGQGNFGVVHRGELVVSFIEHFSVLVISIVKGMTARSEVAVKKLPDQPPEQVVAQFMKEIQLLKNFEPHPNVVKFVLISDAIVFIF